MPTDVPVPEPDLLALMDGFLNTQLLYVAVRLDIAEALVRGPRDAGALARETGTQPAPLQRVLRGLAALGVLMELPGGFALSPAGERLRADHPASVRGPVLARGDLYYASAAALLDAVRGEGTPFELTHGEPFFDLLDREPERAAAFQASMTARSRREAEAVVSAYDFGRFRRLLDAGGGTGVLLEAILSRHPALLGTLFDRPEVARLAGERLAGTEVKDRCTVVAGDFFTELPTRADAIVLSRVIHDWGDDESLRIFQTCRRALSAGGTLLLVEATLPERAADDPAAIRMDLHMLLLLPGRERTEAEYRVLLEQSGFRWAKAVPTAAGVSVLEAVAD